jgi:zinc transport system ATP-binding protein
VLTCRNASFSYSGSAAGKAAVENVSFELASGDYLCVVGENGSGKSTLMKGLLGLLPPSGGQVHLNVKRTEIGYLPQQTAAQKDFPASVEEVVLSGRLNRHGFFSFYSRRDRTRANEAMERLGVAVRRRTSYRELSGGQQRRVLLARALCAADKLLMLDEPAAGLDPRVASEMYALLEGLNRDGMTLVMISHDLRGALRYGNKVLHLRRRPLFCGKTQEYVKTDFYRRLEEYDDESRFDRERFGAGGDGND